MVPAPKRASASHQKGAERTASRTLHGAGASAARGHVIAYAIGQGVTPAAAATALGTVSLVSLAGRLATGWLSDRMGRAPTLTIMYTSAAIGIGCLAAMAATGAPMWLTLYVAFYGMAQGSSGIVASARSADVFAGASFSAI